MHHGTCVTHRPWCTPGLLTCGFFRSRWRGQHSRHSRRMRNPKFYVSGKKPTPKVMSGHDVVGINFKLRRSVIKKNELSCGCKFAQCMSIDRSVIKQSWCHNYVVLTYNWHYTGEENKACCDTPSALSHQTGNVPLTFPESYNQVSR